MPTASGKNQGKGPTLAEVFRMFPDDEAAERWLVSKRWPDGVTCPHCHSGNVHASQHPTMPYHCRPCRRRFSVRVGTLMAASKIGYRTWVLAIFLTNTGLQGVSSRKLRRDLGITQRSCWHLAHRIRQTWEEGKRRADKRLRAGRGKVGKTAACRGEGPQVRGDGEDPAIALAQRQGKTATPGPLVRDVPELTPRVERLVKQAWAESSGLAQRLDGLEANLRLLCRRVEAIERPGEGSMSRGTPAQRDTSLNESRASSERRDENAEREPV